MPYSQPLVDRLHTFFISYGDAITEKKMFGGYSFLYKGKMCIGVIDEKLVVRVLEPTCSELLTQKGFDPMDFTGKVMKEFVFVSPARYTEDSEIKTLIELGIAHAKSKL